MNVRNYFITILPVLTFFPLVAMEEAPKPPLPYSLYHRFAKDHLSLIKQHLEKQLISHKTDDFVFTTTEKIPMFVQLKPVSKLLFPSNWHRMNVTPLQAHDEIRHQVFQEMVMISNHEDRIVQIPITVNPCDALKLRHIENGRLFLDGPNETNVFLLGNNTTKGESICYLIKPTIHGTQPQEKIVIPKKKFTDAIVALAHNNKNNFAVATKDYIFLYTHSDVRCEQVCMPLFAPEQLKKIAFITATTLLCLGESGHIYICWKHQNSLKMARQKIFAQIETFAIDPVNHGQMVFLKKNHNYDDPLYYCNLKERGPDGKIHYFLMNQQNFDNPQHTIKGLWFYNGVIGLLSKMQLANNTNPEYELLKQSVSYISKKHFLEYAHATLNPDSAKSLA